MSETSDVIVKIDDRIRLLSAVIAATDYPDKMQRHKPHGTHAHARATRKHVADHANHPAVQATQALLDENTPLEALFALVMLMEWPNLNIPQLPPFAPPQYNIHLRDFYEKANLEAFWKQEANPWNKSMAEAQNVFKDVKFKTFYKPFLGEISQEMMFMPSIGYPSSYDVGFQIGNQLVCISPPPLAWGDSPPWPYDEPTMVTSCYRSAMIVYGDTLLRNYLRVNAKALEEIVKSELPLTDQFKAQYPSWEEQFSTLFLSAIVAMYLEEHVDDREYKSYMLMEKKARGLTNLPGTVSVLRRYLQEVGGDKYNNLIEFLPVFPKQLRVAQRIVTF